MAQARETSATATSQRMKAVGVRRIRRVVYYALGKPALLVLDWLWKAYAFMLFSVLLLSLLGTASVSWVTTGNVGLSDPRSWAVTQPLIQNPDLAAIVAILVVLLGIGSYLGHRAASRVIPPELQIFGVTKVATTRPDMYIRNFNSCYIPRHPLEGSVIPSGGSGSDADANARLLLSSAESRLIQQGSADKVGICVWGEPMLGSTRLAWEALKHVAGPWTFISWPENAPLDKWDELFNILTRRRAKIVLWLDNLDRYARAPGAVSYINSLPSVLDARRIRYVVVATCHEMDPHGPIHQKFEPLLQRLDEVRPARMSDEDMQRLGTILTHSGQVVGFNEHAFDGLPGSIVLGVTRMRDQVYPRLGPAAHTVLRTVKLLRSAGITESTYQRVTIVASDAFRLESAAVVPAIDVLRQSGFLATGNPTSDGQPTVAPSTDFFFDVAVPDYPTLADAVSEWPLLEQCLKHISDGIGLIQLGDAFRDQQDYVHAAECYEAALPMSSRGMKPLEWASIQYGLGLALVRQAAEAQEPERTTLLERAQDCFTGVLSVINRQNNPAVWAGALEAWKEVMRRVPKSTRTPSRIQSIDKALEEARQVGSTSQSDSATARAEAQLNVGVLEFLQARLEQNAHRRWRMLDRAIATLRTAAEAISPETAPSVWSRLQSTLGDVLRIRADSASDQTRESSFLEDAARAYVAALSVDVPERTHSEEADLYSRGGEALDSLATLKVGDERLALLTQAMQAIRRAVAEYGKRRQQYPVERAEAQIRLARVMSELARERSVVDQGDLVTEAIIQYEDAVGVLDPDGSGRADEIQLRIAELLYLRAKVKAISQPRDASFDLARASSLCDLIVKRAGSRERNAALYAQARTLQRDADTLKSTISLPDAVVTPASLPEHGR